MGTGIGTCCHLDKTDHSADGKHTAEVLHMSLPKCHDHCASMKTCTAFEYCSDCDDKQRCEFHHKPVTAFQCLDTVDSSNFECFVRGHAATLTLTSTTHTTHTMTQTTATTTMIRECYQCGDDFKSEPCTTIDLVLHKDQPSSCPAGKNFGCMNTIIQTDNGQRQTYKKCVDYTECNEKWLEQSSDKAACVNFDVYGNLPLVCHFCCIKDNCNEEYVPDEQSWWH